MAATADSNVLRYQAVLASRVGEINNPRRTPRPSYVSREKRTINDIGNHLPQLQATPRVDSTMERTNGFEAQPPVVTQAMRDLLLEIQKLREDHDQQNTLLLTSVEQCMSPVILELQKLRHHIDAARSMPWAEDEAQEQLELEASLGRSVEQTTPPLAESMNILLAPVAESMQILLAAMEKLGASLDVQPPKVLSNISASGLAHESSPDLGDQHDSASTALYSTVQDRSLVNRDSSGLIGQSGEDLTTPRTRRSCLASFSRENAELEKKENEQRKENKTGMHVLTSVDQSHEVKDHKVREAIRTWVNKGESHSRLNLVANRIALMEETMKEPERTGPLALIVLSHKFEILSGFVIVLNSLYVAIGSEWELAHLDQQIPQTFDVIDNVFLSFYFIELCLRLAVHRWYFFVNDDARWNNFDAILVFLSLCDVFLQLIIPNTVKSGNVSFVRIFRLLKVGKILRALRILRAFKELAIVLDSFKQCFISLFWSLVMMLFSVYVFSLIFMQGVIDWLQSVDDDVPQSAVEKAQFEFGSVLDSMLSLYMAVTSGNDWSVYYWTINSTGRLYGWCFLFFTFYFSFALFNILTAIFVEKAVVANQPVREEVILNERRKHLQDITELRRLCDTLNIKNTGILTWDEFEEAMGNDILVAYLSSMGLEVHDCDLFFQTLQGTGDGVTMEQFVEGCLALKGHATSLDLQRQLFETRQLSKQMKLGQEAICKKIDTIRGQGDPSKHL